MSMSAYVDFASAAARFHLQNPDLAPGAWRELVARIAEGFPDAVGDRTFCGLCKCQIHGAQGHVASCPTMLARRIRANEAVQPVRPALWAPVLRRAGALPALPLLPGVDIDAAHAQRLPAESAQRTGTAG